MDEGVRGWAKQFLPVTVVGVLALTVTGACGDDSDDTATIYVSVSVEGKCSEEAESCPLEPVAGATVTVDGVGTKTTDDTGKAIFVDVQPGVRGITVEKQPYRVCRGVANPPGGGATDSSCVLVTR